MADLSRLFNFLAGQIIKSSEMNTELNQLIARINALEADSFNSGVAEALGLSQTGVVRRGKSIIPAEESRTNTAYGTLTTPDVVTGIALPTNGLIVVAYQAMWKCTVSAGNAFASLFLGSNQLKTATSDDPAPIVQEAVMSPLNQLDTYKPLSTYPGGLTGRGDDTDVYTGDVATGQIVGSGNPGAAEPFRSGVCHIFAGPGTYDVSVQFKASPSGTLTAKDRKLWVWTIAF